MPFSEETKKQIIRRADFKCEVPDCPHIESAHFFHKYNGNPWKMRHIYGAHYYLGMAVLENIRTKEHYKVIGLAISKHYGQNSQFRHDSLCTIEDLVNGKVNPERHKNPKYGDYFIIDGVCKDGVRHTQGELIFAFNLEYPNFSKWYKRIKIYYENTLVLGLECHHIMPESSGGESTIENGILLCKEHHRQLFANSMCQRAGGKDFYRRGLTFDINNLNEQHKK